MGQAAEQTVTTFDDFLAFIVDAEGRYELVDGEIFAMTGAALRHVDVTTNIVVALHGALAGRPCKVRASDAMVRTAAGDALYPDVVVTCGEKDTHPLWISHPVLVVEVLSESTAAYDRGKKFEKYRGIDDLAEYVLVDPDRRAVDVFRRSTEGRWTFEAVREDSVQLACLDLELPLDAIYA